MVHNPGGDDCLLDGGQSADGKIVALGILEVHPSNNKGILGIITSRWLTGSSAWWFGIQGMPLSNNPFQFWGF